MKILVIDDDSEICELLSLFLRLEGFAVLTVKQGMRGIELVREEQPDLVILDIGLPDINGQQICKLIRSYSNVPIIMLSARDSVSDKVLALDYGADDYITKPFENMELLARINAVLRRVEKHKEEGITEERVIFHHLTIDTSKRTVQMGNEEVRLTPKEFELLLYFSKNSNQVVSRDKIVRDLWGDDVLYKWSRSLDVHIQNLRQKIELNPKYPEVIKTVSGIGYRIR